MAPLPPPPWLRPCLKSVLFTDKKSEDILKFDFFQHFQNSGRNPRRNQKGVGDLGAPEFDLPAPSPKPRSDASIVCFDTALNIEWALCEMLKAQREGTTRPQGEE